MKITKTILAFAFVSLLTVSCKKGAETKEEITEKEVAAPKKEVVIAAENVQTASFEIEGMTCAIGCAKTIEEELGALDGVQKATVDFDSKKATVVFDKTIQSQESLTKVVEATADGKTYKVVLPKS
ncbi:MAG: Mercuric transport protein periplasmic component precursor [Bacteroidota bacterium]|jgi:mercuric ion binding protein